MQRRQPGEADPGAAHSGPLTPLGVNASEELVYRVLLEHPNATMVDVATATGWDLHTVRRRIRTLEELGLLTRTSTRPGRFTAAPPVAVEMLALRRHEEIERARLAATTLAERFGAGHGEGAASVTVIRGREAVAHRFLQAQQAAKQEVLMLDKPPYFVEPHQRRRALLRSGVSYRTIYDQAALADAETLTEVRELAALGERSRVLADVPMKLMITDRSTALVPIALPADWEVLILPLSPLVDGLMTLFEAMWPRATPLWPAGTARADSADDTGLSALDEQLLALAASGLTDQAIARRLGKAQRTVERRMQRIMALLGAKTRFQAGLQAAGRGILGDRR